MAWFGKAVRALTPWSAVASAKKSVMDGAEVIRDLSGSIDADSRRAAAADETFDAACQRFGLTEERIREVEKSLLMLKRVVLAMAYLVLGVLIANLVMGLVLGAVMSVTLLPLLFLFAVRQQFRLDQVRQRQLLSFKEFRSQPRWLARALDLEVL